MAVPRLIPPPLTLAWWAYELRFGLVFCLLISVVVTALWGKPFSVNLAYSYAIGLLTQAWIELGRYLLSAWVRRHRPLDEAAQAHWPGWPLMGPWMLASVALGYTGGAWIGDALVGGTHVRQLFSEPLRTVGAFIAVTLLAAFAATMHLYVKHRWAAVSLARASAERVAAETRLKLLEAQLDPHMLFNTLANLRALIQLDPPRAVTMIDHLNRFLRATLGGSRAPMHPLAEEFQRLEDYLALMQIRMGPRLRMDIDLPEELAGQPVPPLLLQPLVENAIRHGLEPQAAGGTVHVAAQREGEQVRLVVRDDGVGWLPDVTKTDGPSPGATGGVGLALIRERLATRYGERARLEVHRPANGGTEAAIILPAGPPPELAE